MRIAERIWECLDLQGLTPQVHYLAAPADWRYALEAAEREIEDEMEDLLTLACDSDEGFRAPYGQQPNESLVDALRRMAAK